VHSFRKEVSVEILREIVSSRTKERNYTESTDSYRVSRRLMVRKPSTL
jgi:hypothetical protein